MSNEHVQEEGFWGGITLIGIIWGVLAFLAFATCFAFVYFLVVFTVYAIWYLFEKLSGHSKAEDNPADIISVFNFFAGLIYTVTGLFLLGLFLKALTM